MGAIGLDADLFENYRRMKVVEKYINNSDRGTVAQHMKRLCSWARAREINSARAMLWVLAS